jgi:surface polysaccharide O-acyltransferase-like enzyme
LATVAVPLFFFLSGYLFFTGFAPSKANFYSNIGKRAKSLLIPFLFWNILCLTVTGIAQALPATSGFFSGRSAPIVSFKLLDYANAVLGLTRDPIAFQFWFIRDLMLLSLLSPLIYLLLRKASAPFLAALLVWWFAGSTYSLPILAREAVLFFSVGSLLAIRHIDLRVLDRIGLYSWIYVPLSIADTLSRHLPANHFVHRIAELCGILFVICATRYIWRARRLREILIALSSASFFVFASHEPLLTVVRKLSYRFLPLTGNIVVVSLYVGDTLLVVAICTAAYYFCARTMPAVTQIITGGRIGGASRSARPEILSSSAVLNSKKT